MNRSKLFICFNDQTQISLPDYSWPYTYAGIYIQISSVQPTGRMVKKLTDPSVRATQHGWMTLPLRLLYFGSWPASCQNTETTAVSDWM